MADVKYGRLFTEADMRKLLRYAATRGEEVGVEALGHDAAGFALDPADRLLMEYEAEAQGPFGLTFPADEPLFLLRGQDAYAPVAVGTYLDELERCGQDDPEHVRAGREANRRMAEWQRANPNRVKLPD